MYGSFPFFRGEECCIGYDYTHAHFCVRHLIEYSELNTCPGLPLNTTASKKNTSVTDLLYLLIKCNHYNCNYFFEANITITIKIIFCQNENDEHKPPYAYASFQPQRTQHSSW